MTVLIIVLAVVLVIGVAGVMMKRRFERMPGKKKKKLFTKTINNVYLWFEDHGLMRRNPAFMRDYHKRYRGLKELEEHHADVQRECLELLQVKEQLTDVRELGAGYTKGGIHLAQWKAFMFKSGDFIEENCKRAPKTAALIRRIPGVYTAFFSVLYPHQVITPHWGYYKGFLRYHLGVVIPGNNEKKQCWIRVNSDPKENALDDKALIEHGERYYWKNGEGIIFDDNYLHDAANESDEIRVVLWLDLRRKMPFYAAIINHICLWLVYRDNTIEKIRRGAIIGAEGVVNPA